MGSRDRFSGREISSVWRPHVDHGEYLKAQ